jgi:hypothetical protein
VANLNADRDSETSEAQNIPNDQGNQDFTPPPTPLAGLPSPSASFPQDINQANQAFDNNTTGIRTPNAEPPIQLPQDEPILKIFHPIINGN